MNNKTQAYNIELEAVFDKDLADKKQAQNSGIHNNQKQHNSAIQRFYKATRCYPRASKQK